MYEVICIRSRLKTDDGDETRPNGKNTSTLFDEETRRKKATDARALKKCGPYSTNEWIHPVVGDLITEPRPTTRRRPVSLVGRFGRSTGRVWVFFISLMAENESRKAPRRRRRPDERRRGSYRLSSSFVRRRDRSVLVVKKQLRGDRAVWGGKETATESFIIIRV